MSDRHELPESVIEDPDSVYRQERLKSPFTQSAQIVDWSAGEVEDGVHYFDWRDREQYVIRPSGVLYVRQPYQTDFCPFKPAKIGDVGRDLPVRIRNMRDAEVTVRTSPFRDYYINWEEGWVDIPPHGYGELPSGIHIKVPDNAWGMIRPRSSTGWKRRLTVFEGTIDLFIGHLCCLVHNPHNEPIRIHDGEKLAQLIIVPKYNLEAQVYVSELPDTVRGSEGFGSSGV